MLRDRLARGLGAEADAATEKDRHVVAWLNFLKTHIDRIDLSKQVASATSGVTPVEATKDRLHKNMNSKLGAPQPLVSQHLRVLRGAGVVRGARRGREIAYSLVDDHVAHIVADAISHAGEAPR